ncbi:MAG: FAD-binding oxidoreductase [Gemmatimonadetes bacterium]|nr:FAD-binding oxidoreductase [Gemmatimonadota bacterium]
MELRTRLAGTLLMPADPGYDDARSVWNGMIDRRPAAIARCLGVADVVACVRWAREQLMPISVKSGGHNISGLAVADGALLVDTSLMRGVLVDVRDRVAHAQAGCLLGDIDRETQVHGLAAVLGFVSQTGAAGLTLGGGFGYLTRRYGWTSDNLRALEVVTAEGRVVRASDTENPDLFWGLRGGGGNFGIVTRFEHHLFPIGPEIVGGAIAWRGEDAPEVLDMYRKLAREAPPELAVIAGLRLAPPAPWLPKEIHGKPIVVMFVCHSGDVAAGERLVAPLKAFGKPVGDIVQRRTYASQQSLIDATQPKGRRYYWKSEYLPEVSADLLREIVAHAGAVASPHSAILLFPLDGALNRLSEDHSAVGNRKTGAIINVAAAWEKPEHDGENIEWARSTWRDVRRFSTGGVYVNFLTEDEGEDRIHAAYGANYDRLAELKAAWDPDNLFRINKNIAPRARPGSDRSRTGSIDAVIPPA